ncbi:MAG: class I SAM-dependent methyltransferase [Candidatus Marinimicrobia bacterium]|nr:class I SAM-dependent methyltransferase [Candidatus Neomarinimicrobiota bacterium]MBT7423607.1 class I SAM-dependent methyltransferase [Candidatus Neomarinimicrobiota bacterium]MDG2367134.1 class I SAM-dependent methyltransferase [Candidatus Neomarinimicrobiota bacterium]
MKNYSENYWAKRAKSYNKTSWVKNESFIDGFLEMIGHKSFSNILEVGIGTGALAKIISEKKGPLIGIDISKEMINKINHNKITPIVGNAHDLPFEDNTFDLIYMRNVIHYLDDPKKVFSEIYRCLKSKGTYMFSQVVPPNDNISTEYDWLVGRDIHYPTKNEILKLFSIFNKINHNDFLLENQSISNWLNNTCQNEEEKQKIIDRHRKTSKDYRRMANYRESEDDIFVSIRHFMVSGEK